VSATTMGRKATPFSMRRLAGSFDKVNPVKIRGGDTKGATHGTRSEGSSGGGLVGTLMTMSCVRGDPWQII